MNTHIQPLIAFLNDHFLLHSARVKCLANFIICLLKSKRVNLVVLSQVFDSRSKVESCYRRLQRFLAQINLPEKDLAKSLVALIGLKNQDKWTLILDRTNWKFGSVYLNILYLAVAYKGVSIPLFFSLLEDKKQGNSDHLDRIDLLEMFVETFGTEVIEVLLGDREFIGSLWVQYLNKHKIPYVMRLKENGQHISNCRGKMTLGKNLFRFLEPGQCITLKDRQIGGTNPYRSPVSALKTHTGELVVVMHSRNVDNPIELYANRWQIECMFKAFKSNGFNLEETHVTDPDRFMTLLAVVAMAFCLAYKQGICLVKEKPHLVRLKKHGAPPKSIFKIGLDCLQNLLTNMMKGIREIKKVLRIVLKPLLQNKKLTHRTFVM